MDKKYRLPPFNFETATQKVQMAEDAWNTKNPDKVSLAYTDDTEWRNRHLFINGQDEVKEFLTAKYINDELFAAYEGLGRIYELTHNFGKALDLTCCIHIPYH